MSCSKEFELEITASMPTLLMHLICGVGITHSNYGAFERIDPWADQSGNGNDASQAGTTFFHPLFGTGLDPGATGLNAYATIAGGNAGTNQCGLDHNLELSAPATIIAVVGPQGSGATFLTVNRCLAYFGYTNLYHCIGNAIEGLRFFGTDAGGTFVPGSLQLVPTAGAYPASRAIFGVVIRAYDDITLFCVDAPGTNPISEVTWGTGGPFVSSVKRIGNAGTVAACNNSQLYELQAYSGAMGDAQRNAMIASLQTTYG